MKKRIRLTESQLVNMIKKAVKRVLKEQDDDIFNSDSSEHKYNIEDFTDWEFDAYDDILHLNFGEEGEDYKVDWDAYWTGSYERPTLEYPGSAPELKIEIEKITKIHPNEKKMSKYEFYAYLKELGIYKRFMKNLEEVGEERANDKDGPEYDDFD